MSEANRSKIFDLAKELNYFQSDFDSHLKHIAQTGSKTLEYKSATGTARPPTTGRRMPMCRS